MFYFRIFLARSASSSADEPRRPLLDEAPFYNRGYLPQSPSLAGGLVIVLLIR